MRIQTKRKFAGTIIAVLMVLSALFIMFMSPTTTTASAANNAYTVKFDYECSYHARSSYGNNDYVAMKGTDVVSAEVYYYSNNKTDYSITLSGNAVVGANGILQKGGLVTSSSVTISMTSKYESGNIYVRNENDQIVASASGKSITVNNLSEGTYKVTLSHSYSASSTYVNAWYAMTASFEFRHDSAAPTISGASASATGKYTNSAFTVTASDTGSGVAAFYWRNPSASSYSSVSGSSKTVAAGSANGLYRFYATDKAGNTSATYYVYYDNVAPTGKVTTSGGKTIPLGGSLNESFSYTATDSGSGISSITYTTPSSSVWKTYTSGTTIDKSAGYGAYSFKATDKAGNSETYTVTLADPCANGHDYKPKTIQPTCTTGGYTIYSCSRCGVNYTTDKTSALGHSYTAKTTAATCTSGGYTTYTCTRCGYSFTGNTTVALGHSYEAMTTSSSCTEKGYITYKCSRCGVSYTDSPTQATGHSYVTEIIEPTCTERGYTVFTCTKCGDTYTGNETAAIGHNYVSEVIAATCSDGGYTKYTCTRCGHSYTGGEIRPAGHHYVTTTVAANCTQGGYSLHTCGICGESYQDNITQPNGHNFISSTREATCTQFGGTVYNCQVCGFEYSDNNGIYPTGHNYTSAIVTSPTCTAEGLRRSVCDNCGDTYDTVIPANGHSYIISDVVSENGITTRTYTCTVCGASYTQELGDQYEEVSNYVEYLFEQYSPYMWWVLLTAAGVWSIVMGVFFAIAQKNEDKEKAKKMIINYVIGLVVIAIIVVACPYLIRGIAALVT